MARQKFNAGGRIFVVEIEDLERTSDDFKAFRKGINNDLKGVFTKAGEAVLPYAKHNVSHLKVEGTRVAPTLYVKSTAKGASLTTKMRGKKRNAFGLLEFGGTVDTAIVPKKKRTKAIKTPWGPRAIVYRGSNMPTQKGLGLHLSRLRSAMSREAQMTSHAAVYKGNYGMVKAVKKNRRVINRTIERELNQMFERIQNS